MPELDINALKDELGRRHGIRADVNDPAFAIVALNNLVLEHAINELVSAVAQQLTRFEEAVQRVETRAGKTIAQQTVALLEQVREDLRKHTARIKEAHSIYLSDKVLGRAGIIASLIRELLSAAALLGLGVLIGVHYLRSW